MEKTNLEKLRCLSQQALDDLESRARAQGIIGHAEHLSLVVSVTDNPKLDVSNRTKALLEMTPREFFTDERFAQLGLDVAIHKPRIIYTLESDGNNHAGTGLSHEGFPVKTLDDLLKISRQRYRKRRCFGDKTIDLMVRVLASQGLRIPE